MFSRRRFLRRHGRAPDPRNARRLSDRLYRIKTDGSLLDPLVQCVTDKEFAKLYIAQAVGSHFLPDTHCVLRSVEDVNAFVPKHFPCVVKPTHLNGRVIFCTDPDESIDRKRIRSWLRADHYSKTREANYRHLCPKIIVEEFISDDGLPVPKDYKLFCFHGVPKLVQVDSGRFHCHTRNFYDMRWNRLPMAYAYPSGPEDEEPPLLGEMSQVASRLASAFSFVRIDLYASQTRVCVGELTFCPEGANAPILPDAADAELAQLFDREYRLDANAVAEAWACSGSPGGVPYDAHGDQIK